MKLIGTKKNPPKWPVNVFWILVGIHLPIIAIMLITSLVEGTLLAMIHFWLVTVPMYVLGLLFDPLRLISAIIAIYVVWYALQFDWGPFFASRPFTSDNFVRGRRLLDSTDFRTRLATRRRTLQGGAKPVRRGLGMDSDNSK